MTKQKIIISLIIAAVVITGAWYAVSMNNSWKNSADSGNVVATVNGAELSREDFDAQFQQAQQSYLQQGVDVSDAQFVSQLETQVLDQMIAKVLLKQEAEKLGLTVDNSEVDTELASIIESVGGRDAFDQQLVGMNLSEEELKNDIIEQFLINKYIETQVPEDQTATDEEARALYDQANTQQDLPPFEEIKEQAKAEVIRQKQDQLIQALVASLRESADIKISL